MMWYVMRMFTGSGNKTGTAKSGEPVKMLVPRLPRGHPLDMHLYLSERDSWQAVAESEQPIWTATDFGLAESDVSRHFSYTYRPSAAVQNNGSVFVHAVFVPTGASPNPKDDFFDKTATFARTNQLNRYMKKRAAKGGINLLSGKNSTDDAAMPDDVALGNETVIVSYLKPNVTLHMVDDFGQYNSMQVPPQYKDSIDVDPSTMTYAPHTWFNDFWLLRDYMVPVNESVSEVEMHLELSSAPSWKFMLFSQMDHSFSMQRSWGAMGDGESDEVKRIFLEGNPLFLALTMCVSLLHSVFDMLAFKNDIGFWKDNKSMKGLSARTILFNAGCQVIIFLYLLDSETSMVVLLSAGMGTLIEFWKVTKAMDVKVVRLDNGLPWLSIKDRGSYTQSKTDQYDAEAMRYLSYALFPLVAGYSVYALLYQTHRSWYSWILNSLVGAVYTFGFVLMCPQLYLNYRLKSVAHLPWRQMTYKFLNTIIDDLFAFVIKMPMLHRLSVFRDDLVFLVYLYQRWIYRVDKKRANEFGYAEEQGEEVEQQEGEQQQLADTPAPADEQVASGSDAAAPKPRARARGKAARGKEEEEEEVGEEAEEKKEL